MTTPVFLVPDGDAVYAVPVEEAKKYMLEGESLAIAVAVLSEEVDVVGQNSGTSKPRARVADLNKILDKARAGNGR